MSHSMKTAVRQRSTLLKCGGFYDTSPSISYGTSHHNYISLRQKASPVSNEHYLLTVLCRVT